MEIKKSDRLLLKEHGKLYEATVWEISPSGEYAMLLLKDSVRIWLRMQEVKGLLVEVLA